MCRMGLTILLWLNVVSMAPGRTLRADLNGDCRVDMQDMMILLSEWMMEDEDCLMGLGPELVTNGGFDTDSDWYYVGGASITNGKLHLFTLSVCAGSQEIAISQGKTYQVHFEVSDYNVPPGTSYVKASLGMTDIEITGDGVYELEVVSGIGIVIGFYGYFGEEFFSCNIDNVSVREVLSGGLGFGPTLIEHAYENF